MDFEKIILEINDGVAVLTLNHPEALNAIGKTMNREIKEALDVVSRSDSGARCLLITGAGRGFCAGANLMDPPGEDFPSARERYIERWLPMFLRLRDLRMPWVSAVKGPVAGVGMSLALSADIILAGKSAYFLQAFTRIGLAPDGGATYILPRLIGRARAMELSLLAERLSAEKAFEWGLINRLCDDEMLMTEAMELSTRLAKGPTLALTGTRRAYWRTFDNTYEQQFYLEADILEELSGSEDATEGGMAFFEKREARFKGK